MSGALDRIKARQTSYPNIEGTFLHDAFAPVAGELDMMTDEYIPAALAAYQRLLRDYPRAADEVPLAQGRLAALRP